MIWKFHSSLARGRSAPSGARAKTGIVHACIAAGVEACRPHRPAPLYRGSCLCGSVRYEVQLDAKPEASVRSVWEQTVRPGHFKLLSGEETLSGHQFAGDQTHHYFCERCGVRSFSHHAADAEGAFYSVDLKSLERAHATHAAMSRALC